MLMKGSANLPNRMTLCSEMEHELQNVVLCDQKFTSINKLNKLPCFLKLINYGRESALRNNPFEIGLIYYKFLEFWYEIDEKEMIVEYILRLYTFHKSKDDFIQAAYSLQNYAIQLRWSNHSSVDELSTLSKRLKLDTNVESEVKERLYWMICELFEKGQFWELAIPLLKELAKHYETEKIDYEKLAKVMGKLQGNPLFK